MTKRKTLAEQVHEQFLIIEALQEKLAQAHTDGRIYEEAIARRSQEIADLKELHTKALRRAEEAEASVNYLLEAKTKLEKELESQKNSYKYQSERADKAEAEIEQAHAALDTIPEAVPKEFEKAYGTEKHKLASRFMGTLVAVLRAAK